MRKSILCTTMLLLSILFAFQSKAQYGADNRNKIVLTVTADSKSVSADLNAISTSISRNNYDEVPEVKTKGKDSTASVSIYPPSGTNNKTVYYLSMDAKGIESAMLQILAKKGSSFDGTVTITDSYGKNPGRKISFKHGSLANYSDQFSGASYDGGYGNVNLSITCTELTIDGVTIE